MATALAAAAAAAVTVTSTLGPDRAGAAEGGTQARSARDFVDSIGVNTHLGRPEGIYGRYDDLVRPALAELGIRHIREGVQVDGASTDFFDRSVRDLAANGIRSTVFWGGDYGQEALGLPRWAERTRALGDAVEAVTGPNEPNLSVMGFQYQGNGFADGEQVGSGWAAGTRAYQCDLYATVKNDPELRDLPVVGPSMGWGKASEEVGDLTGCLDKGDFHAYTAEGYGPESAMDDWHLRYARVMSADEPLLSTEGGYSTTGVGTHTGVSEYAHARYVPRMFLEHFARGVERTFSYELLDEDPTAEDAEGGFGLVRQDGSLKPAGTAVRNLIALLDDKGTATPGTLAYSLDGAGEDVRQVLLQKADGRFYLVLWQAAKNQDGESTEPVRAEEQSVTLTLDSPAAAVRTYRPLESAEPLTSGSGAEVRLSVPDQPLVVEVTPGG